MAPTIFGDLDNSNATPLDQLHSKEFIDGMLKAGSLIAMLENKKINVAALFTLLLEKESYQEFFTEITASDSFREALLSLLFLFPSLVKSKVTKTVVRKINAKKPTQRPGKASIQQALDRIKVGKKQTVQAKKELPRRRKH